MLTRAQFLKSAAGSIAGLFVSRTSADAAASHATRHRAAVGAGAARTGPYQSFRSRPDLRPPRVYLHYPAGESAPSTEGYLLLDPTSRPGAQAGALIVDGQGQLVWFKPVRPGWWASNFRMQDYRGQPALTWWEGVVRPPGYGRGEGVILDSSYREVARVRAAGGRQADLHEFRLTPHGTALITCHPPTVQADLSGVGGSSNGQVLESIIQEIDVRTGRLLFEWRSLEHVGVDESYLPPTEPYDYLHVNSIDLTPDGNLLVSGRNACALYKVGRRSGKVLWRLGGRRSDFAMRPGSRFSWQHDAQHLPGSRISVFDNGSGPVRIERQSRGLVLEIDQIHRSVRLVHAYRHPRPLLTGAMGSVQTLPDGNVMVGWGLIPTLSEFTPNGRLVCDLELPWGYNCYRGYRMPWTGTPTESPALASGPGRSAGTSTLYASWNGATGVSAWQVSVGPSPAALQPASTVPRTGFETAIPLTTSQGYAQVTALDPSGAALASSAPVQLGA